MSRKIRTAAVIGSGVMGGGIAALLASAGIKTLLLDIVPFDLKEAEKNNPAARNRIVKAGMDTVLMSRPALLMQRKDADLITIGNMEDDFHKLSDCDWIVEVVVENLKIKQELFKRIEPVRKKGTIISSNTSPWPAVSPQKFATPPTVMFPPVTPKRSIRMTLAPDRAAAQAALTPEIPPPMTTTSASYLTGMDLV